MGVERQRVPAMPTIAEQFLQLFQGRTDAWGGDEGRAIYEPITLGLVERHLYGDTPIGVYPVRHKETDPEVFAQFTEDQKRDNMWVRWGCCDIDTGDWSEAYTLANALRLMGFNPHVERSRSKGWHIWIFVERWTHAYQMRRALKVAYKAINLPAKEANPKSELLRPNQLGNYVRLPYKNGTVERQCFLQGWSATSEGTPMNVTQFCEQNNLFTDRDTILGWSAKWFEPARKHITIKPISDSDTLVLRDRLKPLKLAGLFENGPAAGKDRSHALAALAHNTAQAGWKPDDVYAVVCSADMRWGKYADTRNNPEDYYTDIVERAYK